MSMKDYVALSGVTHRTSVIRRSIVNRNRVLAEVRDKIQALIDANLVTGEGYEFDTATLRNMRSDVEHSLQQLDDVARRLDRVADASQAIYHLWTEFDRMWQDYLTGDYQHG